MFRRIVLFAQLNVREAINNII